MLNSLLSSPVNILEVNTSSPSLTNTSIDEISTNIWSFNSSLSYLHFLCVPYSNANFSFELVDGQSLLLNLDAKGICASSGSACSTGSSNPSHVLLAIGLSPELAYGALRTTFGEENTKEDIDYLVNSLQETVDRLRKFNSPK